MQWLTTTNRLLWEWLLPVLLTAAAIVCGVRQRGRPVRGFTRLLRNTYGSLLRRGADADTRQQRRVFAAALAATMGTGNLTGTALALMQGGAGALLWMWVSALLGMFLVYAENRLGMRYGGGTVGYLRHGLGSRHLAAIFALLCAISALGMGCMVQSNTAAQTLAVYGIPVTWSGLLTAAVLLLVLTGGARRVQYAAAWLMPVLCGAYLLICAVILLLHLREIPPLLKRILLEAMGIRAAGQGISAAAMLAALSTGLRRGIFSNEAGLGSSAMLHSDAPFRDAEMQGQWAAAEVFADTVICCTATALVLLLAPVPPAGEATGWLIMAFRGLLGNAAGGFLAGCTVLLAFGTMLGWYPCGAACMRYLFGNHGDAPFLTLYVLCAFAAAHGNPAWVWALCDLCNGLMSLPNLYALLRLRETVYPEKKRRIR